MRSRAHSLAAFGAALLGACAGSSGAGSDAATDVVTLEVDAAAAGPAPKLVAPSAGTRWSTSTPTLRWSGEAATLELCRDRGCAGPVTRVAVSGESATLADGLAPGLWFWRVVSPLGVSSEAREIRIARARAGAGGAVGTVADFDGDGLADVAVTAQYVDSSAGAAYVYPGSSAGLGRWPAVILPGENWNADFGVAVASAGDLDGDGLGDLVVGSPGANASNGVVYVYRGGATGIGTEPWLVIRAPMAGRLRFGGVLSSAGDTDGDGRAEIIAGAPGASFGVAGHAWVYRFDARGVTDARELVAGDTAPQFGASAAGGCDFDADGYPDIAVGAPAAPVWIYRGGAAGVSLTPWGSLPSPGGGAIYPLSVACAGDVNGDGYADLVAGTSGSAGGRVRLWLGGPDGLDATTQVDLRGDSDSDQFGASVAGGFDMDGDGFDDVLVGSDNERAMTRRAYVFAGSAGGIVSAPRLVYARPDRGFGLSVGVSGDVDGDGFDDALVCAMDAQMLFGFRGGASPGTDAAWAVHGPGGGGFGTAVANALEIPWDYSRSMFTYSGFTQWDWPAGTFSCPARSNVESVPSPSRSPNARAVKRLPSLTNS